MARSGRDSAVSMAGTGVSLVGITELVGASGASGLSQAGPTTEPASPLASGVTVGIVVVGSAAGVGAEVSWTVGITTFGDIGGWLGVSTTIDGAAITSGVVEDNGSGVVGSGVTGVASTIVSGVCDTVVVVDSAIGADEIPIGVASNVGAGISIEGVVKGLDIGAATVSTLGVVTAGSGATGISVVAGAIGEPFVIVVSAASEFGFAIESVEVTGVSETGVDPTGAELVGWVVCSSGIK